MSNTLSAHVPSMDVMDLFEAPERGFPRYVAQRAPSAWNEERLALLKDLCVKGSTAWVAQQINEQTGSSFTRNAIIGKLHREDLSAPIKPIGEWHALNGLPKARPRGQGLRKIATQAKKPQRSKIALPPTFMEEQAPDVSFLAISFDDLNDGVCHYPRGSEHPYSFCGQAVKRGSAYCDHCHNLCWVRSTKYDPNKGLVGNQKHIPFAVWR